MIKFLFFLLLTPFISFSQLQIDEFFSDNMVLQRNHSINFRGRALPGKRVTIKFLNKEQTTLTGIDSTWVIEFPPQKASTLPSMVIIRSENDSIYLNNLLIGDLWLCTGQSNMEWPFSKDKFYREEINITDQPLIRLYNPVYAGKGIYGISFSDSIMKKMNTEDFYQGNWEQCDSNTVKNMSAIGYYFAKELTRKESIPIGLINLAIGGAPLETFISRKALSSDSLFSRKIEGNWLYNHELPAWSRERGFQNITVEKANVQPDGPNHPYKPGFAYEAGILPIKHYPIAGVILYQGETNSLEMTRVLEYRSLMNLMINDYRNTFNQPALPFYWVQLSSIDTTNYRATYWPLFRDEQRKLSDEVKYGGMAVSSDIGARNDVHPRDKKTVGERLSKLALHFHYGNRDIEYSGPKPTLVKYKKGNVILRFKHALKGLQTSDGNGLRGFSVDGITDVKAFIIKKKIIVSVNFKPEYIYYGWKPFSDGNLVNSEKLPASTFKVKIK